MRNSLSEFLLSVFLPPFPIHLFLLLIAFVYTRINTILLYFSPLCHSLVIYSIRLCLQLSSPPTVDEDRGRLFPLAAVNVSTFFSPFPALFCFLPPIQTHTVKMTEGTSLAPELCINIVDVTNLYKMTRDKTTKCSLFNDCLTSSWTD